MSDTHGAHRAVAGEPATDALLAEYQALREEILSNASVTATAFTVTATAVGGIIGFGIEQQNWAMFLGAFALILPALWFISSQLASTARIATYIRVFIEPHVDGLAWESRLQLFRGCPPRRPLLVKSAYTMSVTGIYGLLGLTCLGLSAMYFFEPGPGHAPWEVAAFCAIVAILAAFTGVATYGARAQSSIAPECFEEIWREMSQHEATALSRDSEEVADA